MVFHACTIQLKDTGVDAYNAPVSSFSTIATIDMNIQLFNQNSVDDIRYKDATHIGLTYCKTLTDNTRIIDASGKKYDVKLVNNAGRLAQITMKEVR